MARGAVGHQGHQVEQQKPGARFELACDQASHSFSAPTASSARTAATTWSGPSPRGRHWS